METVTTVDEKDREISLQFSFNNPASIPQFLEDLPEESAEIAAVRGQLNEKGSGTDLTNGGQFRGKMVDLRNLPVGLLNSEYELVGVWKQKRIQTKTGWAKGKPYWMIRFRFRLKDQLAEYQAKIGKQAWQELVEKRPMLLGELVTTCSLAFWQVRAWRNPWFQDGQILPGVYAISLNFEGRQPLYEWDPPKALGDEDLPPQFEPDAVFNIG
jgi:hypothetical protein